MDSVAILLIESIYQVDYYWGGSMKKLLSFVAAMLLSAVMALPAFAADFSAAQMKKMSTFLSNFTEVRMMDFSAKEVLESSNPYEMIHFGIRHNYVNNYNRSIKRCNCPYGELSMDGSWVRNTLKKYFDYDLKGLPTVKTPEVYFSDGVRYHFRGADGEATYYARVTNAERLANGHVQMTGTIYNAEEPSDILGTFRAIAKPHTWKGQPTWAIISLRARYR